MKPMLCETCINCDIENVYIPVGGLVRRGFTKRSYYCKTKHKTHGAYVTDREKYTCDRYASRKLDDYARTKK